MSLEIQAHVGCLVMYSAMGTSAKPLQREVEKFLTQNGTEWTVVRYKAIRQAALLLRNGDKDMAVDLYRKHSISYHKQSGLPKGPFKDLVTRYVHARQQSKIRRYDACLRFYTGLTLSEVSEKQATKAYHSITDKPKRFLSDLSRVTEDVLRDAFSHPKGRLLVKAAKENGLDWRPVDLYGSWTLLRQSSYYYSSPHVPNPLSDEPDGDLVWSLMRHPWVPSKLPVDPSVVGLLGNAVDPKGLSLTARRGVPPVVGRIGVIQEAGCKARVVAQPTAALQLAFLPFHKRLDEITHKVFGDESCVYDQPKAVVDALATLRTSEALYTTDLSSATDRFPRSFSLRLLRQLNMSTYADGLDEVCRARWESHDLRVGGAPAHVSYNTGQPMGLYGSFALFNLSNLTVALAAEERAKAHYRKVGSRPTYFAKGGTSTFRVVGDDVMFSDPVVEDNYRGIMESLGVPISEEKSFRGKTAEFAGFLLTPGKEGLYQPYRPYKHPTGASREVSNPIEFMHALGIKTPRLSHRWDRLVSAYLETAHLRALDLSPIFPEERKPRLSLKDSGRLEQLATKGRNLNAEWYAAQGFNPVKDPIVVRPVRDEVGTYRSRSSAPLFSPEIRPDPDLIRSPRVVPGRQKPVRDAFRDPLIREHMRSQKSGSPAEPETALTTPAQDGVQRSRKEEETLPSATSESASSPQRDRRSSVAEKVRRMQAKGIISPSHSTLSSPGNRIGEMELDR